MIKLYLISIVIWAIMIYGTAYLFGNKIRENGWLDVKDEKKNKYVTAFLITAIPIIRVLMFIAVIAMVGVTKEKFEEWQKELNDESN